MSRLAIIAAVAALATTPALASPSLTPSFRLADSASNAPGAKARGADATSILLLLSRIVLRLDSQTDQDPKPAQQSTPLSNGCPDRQNADAEKKTADAKKQLAAGPEPVYLAF
ncbi:MAG: hypothetical protein GC153_02395 [Alphaproteobacteria bacterium]|nr:hypothetical protein [Alphaproteobacteria bacterium]